MKDLFENITALPENIRLVCLKWISKEELNYSDCNFFLQECRKLGYNFFYGLDAIPYNLHLLRNGGIIKHRKKLRRNLNKILIIKTQGYEKINL